VFGQIVVSRPKTIFGKKNKAGLWTVRTNIGYWSVEASREDAVREAESLDARNKANPVDEGHD
jgi:hypothetical protein